jgi:hypothetical protein
VISIILRILSALSLAAWFGAMLFFSSGVAPVAFTVLPNRTLAGNVVNASIAHLHALGLITGVVLLACLVARARLEPERLAWLKVGTAGVILALTLVSGWGVTPPMAEIRTRVGAIDSLPLENGDRQRFDLLHQLSVGLMGTNMLLAMVLIVLEQLEDRGANVATLDGGRRRGP